MHETCKSWCGICKVSKMIYLKEGFSHIMCMMMIGNSIYPISPIQSYCNKGNVFASQACVHKMWRASFTGHQLYNRPRTTTICIVWYCVHKASGSHPLICVQGYTFYYAPSRGIQNMFTYINDWRAKWN